ncbi:MAG: hypothetical protein VX322_00410, partial [Actinomycetota bacterium]|nr:hypothetical protein [Actinomycetota bacterium]
MSGVQPFSSTSIERNGDLTPCIPEYGGANVCGIIPGLLGGADLPDWMPPVVADASAVVVLVLDGLGW